MQITLYTNWSEQNRIGKTLEQLVTIGGRLKEQTSIMDPEIDFTISSGAGRVYDEYLKANYMYIQEFERFYFITGIDIISSGLWRVRGHIDVIETYKDNIMAQTCLIDRTASSELADRNIPDGSLVLTPRTVTDIKQFSVASGSGSFLSSPVNILMCAGGE